MKYLILCLFILSSPLLIKASSAEKKLNLPLRWDNIEKGSPMIAEGPQPHRKMKGLHTVTLEPGEHMILRLPEGETLRLGSPGKSFPAPGTGDTGLEILRSNGSGLYVAVKPGFSTDRRWLSVAPVWPEAPVIKLLCSAKSKQPLQLALLVSRRGSEGEVYPNPPLSLHPGLSGGQFQRPRTVSLRRADRLKGRPFIRLRPGGKAGFRVEGPARLEIVTHLEYTPRDSDPLAVYTLEVKNNKDSQQYSRTFKFETTFEKNLRYLVKGETVPLGRAVRAFLEVPGGPREYIFSSVSPLYLQVLATKPEIRFHGEGGEKEVISRGRGEDNSLRGEGLAAARLIRLAAEKRPDDPPLRTRAAMTYYHHTFYRALPPSTFPSGLSLRYGSYVSRLLAPGDRVVQEQVLYPPLAEKLSQRLSQDYFFPLEKGSNIYELPERRVPTWLRVNIDTGGAVKNETLYVKWEGSPPLRLDLNPGTGSRGWRFRPSDLEMLVSWWLHTGGLFANLDRWYPFIPTAMAEFLIPPEARRIEIYRESKDSVPLYLGLQYRASRPFQLPGPLFLAELEKVHGSSRPAGKLHGNASGRDKSRPYRKEPAPHSLLSAGPAQKCPQESFSYPPTFLPSYLPSFSSSLSQHYLPLSRFIHSRVGTFSYNMGECVNRGKQGTGYLGTAEARKLEQRARDYEAEGQWLPALESWNRLLYHGEKIHRQVALFGRIRALWELHEPFQAEHHLKELFLNDPDPVIRDRAYRGLREQYLRFGWEEKLLTLEAVRVARYPSDKALLSFTRELVRQGEFLFALQAGLLLPPGKRPYDKLSIAAKGAGEFYIAQYLMDEREEIDVVDFRGFRWEEFRGVVHKCSGGGTIYNINRDLYSLVYLASQAEPLELTVRGPVDIKVNLRLLHEHMNSSSGAGPVDDWIEAEIDGKVGWYPVNLDSPNPALRLVGSERGIGAARELPLRLEAGLHRLRFRAEGHALVGRIFRRVPLLPMEKQPVSSHTAEKMKGEEENKRSSEYRFYVLPPGKTSPERIVPVTLQRLNGIISNTRLHQKGTPVPNELNGPGGMIKSFGEYRTFFYLASLCRKAEQGLAEALGVIFENFDVSYIPYFERLKRNSDWEAPVGLRGGVGLRLREFEPPRAEAPFTRVRRALLPPVEHGDILLTGTDTMNLKLRYLSSRNVEVEVQALVFDALPGKKVPLVYRLDNGKETVMQVSPGGGAQKFRVLVPQGEHWFVLRLTGDVPGHYVRLRLKEVAGEKRRVMPLENPGRYFFIVSPDEPLVWDNPDKKSLWLRVDRYREPGDVVLPGYTFIPEGWGRIYIYPGGRVSNQPPEQIKPGGLEYDELESELRVFVRTWSPGTPNIPRHVKPIRPTLFSPAVEPGIPPAGPVVFDDAFSPGGQEDGTFSFEAGYRARRSFEEDNPDDLVLDRYTYLSLQKRYFDNRRWIYHRTGLEARTREDGSHSLALERWLYYRPERSRFIFTLQGGVFLQGLDVDTPTYKGGFEWSGLLQATLRYRHYPWGRLTHAPGVRVFGRYLSLQLNRLRDFARLDDDIYSYYKLTHRRGMVVDDFLQVDPWRSGRWWARFGLATNEDFNPLKPDHVFLTLGLKQHFRWFQVDITHRWRRYFADDYRDVSHTHRHLTMGAAWEHWLNNRHRLTLAARFTRNLSLKTDGFVFSFFWHLGKGRGYRDFSTSELDFSGRRRFHLNTLSRVKNNRVSGIDSNETNLQRPGPREEQP